MPRPKTEDSEKLWPKLQSGDPGECWEFRKDDGTKANTTYPSVRCGGARMPASRAAWILTYGPIPDGMLVCHKCDNTHCANPNHLFLGSHKDNAIDARRKGRAGFAVGGKLCATDVLLIRVWLGLGFTHKKIAEAFYVTRGTIANISRGAAWKWLRGFEDVG